MTSIRRYCIMVAAVLGAVLLATGWWRSRPHERLRPPLSFRQIRWPDLAPRDWDTSRQLRSLDLGALRDADPRAQRLLADMRTAWDAAPTVEALDGAAVRLAGYVVPLEADSRGMTEMLLVPYEGACIHTPPPPANQVVHVTFDPPVKGLRMMDNVRVRGTITAHREATFRAVSGYELRQAGVEKLSAGR
jgi:hypothetical protein